MEKFRIKPNNYSDYSWYIWYTKPRAEKKVRDRLVAKGIETLLPLRKELRQWSDRKKWVETPLFSGYIFTYISQSEWNTVLFAEGVLTFVRSEGKPAMIGSEEINQINCILENSKPLLVEDDTNIQIGELVEIVAGPFVNMQGELVNYKGSHKLAIRIEHLKKVVLVHLPVDYIKSLKRA